MADGAQPVAPRGRGLGLLLGSLSGLAFMVLFALAVWPWVQDILGPILRMVLGVLLLTAAVPMVLVLAKRGTASRLDALAVLTPIVVLLSLWLIVAAIGAMLSAGMTAA
jgi:hypothetical protein